MSNERTEDLRRRAEALCGELAQHPVLQEYWQAISVVLKGSTARGRADQYSDVDFVLFADDDAAPEITRAYWQAGFSPRPDGFFLPLDNWVGHYHLETVSELEGYFAAPDFPNAWEFSCATALHDPGRRFARAVEAGMRELFREPEQHIKAAYLQLQLTQNWLMQPLRRADAVAVSLHTAKILRLWCHLAYLLDERPYPHDKWLHTYLAATRLGDSAGALVADYLRDAVQQPHGQPHQELMAYPQFRAGQELIAAVRAFIKADRGDRPWIDRWAEFV